jgi:poly(3-hydroxybutyrate) depolymerase
MSAFPTFAGLQQFHLAKIVGGLALVAGGALAGCGTSNGDPGGASGAATGGTKAGSGGASGGTPSTAGAGGAKGGAGGSTSVGGGVSAGATGAAGSGGSTAGQAGAGQGGTAGIGGASGGSGGAGGGSGGAGGDTKPSAGCGQTPKLKNSPTTAINYNTISSGGKNRQYILRYPTNYDNKHPYRLIVAYHWNTGSAAQVFDCTKESSSCATTQSPFYGLWDLSKDSTIFVAPDGLNAGWGNSGGEDVRFTDDMLKELEADLCIDESRIFANGFSFGGGMSKAIGCARANVFRGILVYSGGDFLSGCDGGTMPIAYYGSHGLGDSVLNLDQGKAIRDRFVKNNGCTAMNPPQPANGSGMHVCTSYTGCSSGHPARWCPFDGDHNPTPKDRGQSKSWNPEEAWTFLTQF